MHIAHTQIALDCSELKWLFVSHQCFLSKNFFKYPTGMTSLPLFRIRVALITADSSITIKPSTISSSRFPVLSNKDIPSFKHRMNYFI